MGIGKLAVLAVALVLASGGLGAALADWQRDGAGPVIDLDARKDEELAEEAVLASDTDDDDTDEGSTSAQARAKAPASADDSVSDSAPAPRAPQQQPAASDDTDDSDSVRAGDDSVSFSVDSDSG